jgi:hypothetical protein
MRFPKVAKPCLWQIPLGQADPTTSCETDFVEAGRMNVGAIYMANGGFKVFIIQFLVPITLILINLVISMNLFSLVHFESMACRSLAPIR